MLLKNFVSEQLSKINIKIFSFNEDIEEYFKPYFSNLSQQDLNWSINQEKQNREKFNYSCKPDSTFNSFLNFQSSLTKSPKSLNRRNLIQGLHSYNILQNPEYQKMF